MAEGKRGTQVTLMKDSRGDTTTMTYHTKRYTFPAMPPAPGDVKSDGLCVMLETGIHCPFCTGAFSAEFTSAHRRLAVHHPNRAAIGRGHPHIPARQNIPPKSPGNAVVPMDSPRLHPGRRDWYHEVQASVKVKRDPVEGQHLKVKDMRVFQKNDGKREIKALLSPCKKKKIPPPIPPRGERMVHMAMTQSPVPPPTPTSPASSVSSAYAQSDPGGLRRKRFRKIPPPIPPRKRAPSSHSGGVSPLRDQHTSQREAEQQPNSILMQQRQQLRFKGRPLTRFDLNLSPRCRSRNSNASSRSPIRFDQSLYPARPQSSSPMRMRVREGQSHPQHDNRRQVPTKRRPLTKYDLNLPEIPAYRKRSHSHGRRDTPQEEVFLPASHKSRRKSFDGEMLRPLASRSKETPYRVAQERLYRYPDVDVQLKRRTPCPGQDEPNIPHDEDLERHLRENYPFAEQSRDDVTSTTKHPTSSPSNRENDKSVPPGGATYAIIGVPSFLAGDTFATQSLPRPNAGHSMHTTSTVTQANSSTSISNSCDLGRISSIRVAEKKTKRHTLLNTTKHESIETLCHQKEHTIDLMNLGPSQTQTVVSSSEKISHSHRNIPPVKRAPPSPDVGIDQLVDELHTLEDKLSDISKHNKTSKPVNIVRRTIIKHKIIHDPNNTPTTNINASTIDPQNQQQPKHPYEEGFLQRVEQYDSAEDKLSDEIGSSRDTLDTLDELVKATKGEYPGVSRDRTPVPHGHEMVSDRASSVEFILGNEADSESMTSGSVSSSSDEEIPSSRQDIEEDIDDILENADTSRYSPTATLGKVFTQPRKKKRSKKAMRAMHEADKDKYPANVSGYLPDGKSDHYSSRVVNVPTSSTTTDPIVFIPHGMTSHNLGSVSTSVECMPDETGSIGLDSLKSHTDESKSLHSADMVGEGSSDMTSSNYGETSCKSSFDKNVCPTSILVHDALGHYESNTRGNSNEGASETSLIPCLSSNDEYDRIIEVDMGSDSFSYQEKLEQWDTSDAESSEAFLESADDVNQRPIPDNFAISGNTFRDGNVSPRIKSAPQTLDRKLKVWGAFSADGESEISEVIVKQSKPRCRGSWPNPDVLQRMLSPLGGSQVFDVRRTVTPDNLSYTASFYSSTSDVETKDGIENPHTPEPVIIEHKQLMNREWSLKFKKIKEDFDNRPRLAPLDQGATITLDIEEPITTEDKFVESAIHELRRSPIKEDSNEMDRSTTISDGSVLTLSQDYTLCTDQLSNNDDITGFENTRDGKDDIIEKPADQYDINIERRPSVLHASVPDESGNEYASLTHTVHVLCPVDDLLDSEPSLPVSGVEPNVQTRNANAERLERESHLHEINNNAIQRQHQAAVNAHVANSKVHAHERSPVPTAEATGTEQQRFRSSCPDTLTNKDADLNGSDSDNDEYVKRSVQSLIEQFSQDSLFEKTPSQSAQSLNEPDSVQLVERESTSIKCSNITETNAIENQGKQFTDQIDICYERKRSLMNDPIHEVQCSQYSPLIPRKEIHSVDEELPKNELTVYQGYSESDNEFVEDDLDIQIEDIINELKKNADEQALLEFAKDNERGADNGIVQKEIHACSETEKHPPEDIHESSPREGLHLAAERESVILDPAGPSRPGVVLAPLRVQSQSPGQALLECRELGQPTHTHPGPTQASNVGSPDTAAVRHKETLPLARESTRPSTEFGGLNMSSAGKSTVAQTSICTETQMDFAKAKATEAKVEDKSSTKRPSVAEGSICMETQYELAKQHKTKIESENEKNLEKSGTGERRASVATESLCDETQLDFADSKKAAKDAVNTERRSSVATETVCSETQFDLAKKEEEKGQRESGGEGYHGERRSSAATATICMETQLDFAKLDIKGNEQKTSAKK